jgi:hypothetical protein
MQAVRRGGNGWVGYVHEEMGRRDVRRKGVE